MAEMLDSAVMEDAGVDLNEVLGDTAVEETVIDDETPVVEIAEGDPDITDGDVVAEENESQEQTNEEQTEQKEEKWDGRTIPAKLRSLIKQVQGTDPKLAGEIKDSFFTAQNYKQVFGSPKEAAKFKADVDAMGGFEAINAERAEWNQINGLLANGDPALIDHVAKLNPEAVSKMAPRFLESLAKSSPETYVREMSGVIANTFGQRGGLIDVLSAVQQMLKSGDTATATQNLEALTKWALGFEQTANAAPATKKVDPERQKFEQEKAAFAQQKTNSFNQSLATKYDTANRAAIKKELDTYTKGRALDETTLNLISTNAMMEVGNLIRQDKDFQNRLEKLYKAFDEDGATKLLRSHTDKLLPEAVQKIYRAIAGVSGTQQKTVKKAVNSQSQDKTPVTKSDPKITKVNRMPTFSQIDHGRTTKQMIMNNEAVLVNGKKVTW